MSSIADNNKESVLVLQSINVNKIIFNPKDFNINEILNDCNIGQHMECKIYNEEGLIVVRLSVLVNPVLKNGYNAEAANDSPILEIEVKATFAIENNDLPEDFIKDIISQNTIAIVFPYLRSYLSIVSGITELGAITLPILNVVALFKGHEYN